MRTILVAIDGSEAALRALEFAARQVAAVRDTRLHVLYVRLPLRVYGEIEVYAGEERMRGMAVEEAEAVLEAARRHLAGNVPGVDFEQLEGDPAETIVRRATEIGCESIVMGTHGRGRLASAVIGSVAQRVVHLSSVPVTLTR
jgi:nucleotide-binding universal stress UspA family protein